MIKAGDSQKGVSSFRDFFRTEAAAGLCLMAATVLALIAENSGLSNFYHLFLHKKVALLPEFLSAPLSIHHWINDGLMALFFFLVGLELKREAYEGALADRSQIILPSIAALGGMILPAVSYYLIASGDPELLRGWAIPCATDIAFSLGVLALFGKGVPLALRIFLTALAIFDDLGAILVIAVFYSQSLNLGFLTLGGALVALLWIFNWRGLMRLPLYILVGVVLWYAVLKSGIHATLAGVITALFIPMRTGAGSSPLKWIEHELHPWVAFGILPLFAFANAGVRLLDLTMDSLMHPVTLGIVAGLVVGKQLGVFIPAALLIKFNIVPMPQGGTYRSLYGVSLLTGIGFTMSLFIGGLAFVEGHLANEVRVGVIAGSLISAVLGAVVLSSAKAHRGAK